jgi:hypothetical protein
MDPATILADVQLALAVGKLAVQLGQDAAPFLINAYNIVVNDKVLTDDERAAMKAQEAQFRADIDAQIAADDAAGG